MMEPSVDGGTRPTPSRLSRRDRILALLVPAVLVVVAMVQQVRAHTLDQSSWVGAGFGMFATVDEPPHRWAVVTALDEAGQPGEPLPIPSELFDTWIEALVVPTDTNLRRLARAVPDATTDRAATPRTPTAIRVVVYGLEFDDGTGSGSRFQVRAEQINDVVVDR